MRYLVSVNNKAVEVDLISRSAEEIRFTVNGRDYTVRTEAVVERAPAAVGFVPSPSPHATQIPRSPSPSSLTTESNKILAPLHGVVVSVAVAPGAQVKKGDTVVVVEAMKMENSIAALIDGTVESVHVAPGDQVHGGQLLVLLHSATP